MANLGRKVATINTSNSFTARVVYAASDRYETTQFNQTFQVGYEYTGANFFKGLNRPPKLRILSVFQPWITTGGNTGPNASNDTYVAFQVYDYTLNAWRGPWCKRANVNDAWTYVDYFVTTIDSFGRKYGNYYTGTGSSFTTFSAPTALFSQSTSLYLTTLGRSITAIGGHNPNIFTMGGSTNKMYHFHGFLTLAGYSGTWCFYSISANGTGIGFNHLLDVAPYNSGTYPNVSPYTNKFTSEWRLAPLCNITSLGYSPRIRIASTGLGPVKAYFGQDPGSAFPGGVDNVNVFEAEVWCTYDPGSAANFFLTPLWRPGGSTEESEQGVEGTQAAEYAPAGWYGTSAENSYAYWDGLGSWTPNTYATYQPAAVSTEFTYFGFYQSMDPLVVCSAPPEGPPKVGYYDAAAGFNVSTTLFSDSALQTPISTISANRLYYNQTDGITFMANGSGNSRIDMTFKC
jgi:hypothetical protein